MNVLVEGIGSMVFGTQLKYYKEMNWNLIGIDINNKAFGFYNGVKPYIVPKYNDKNCFDAIEKIISKEKIDLVFCSVNEGLLEWSKRKEYLKEKYNTYVIISNYDVIKICVDKWETYKFFKNNQIPTPETSIDEYLDIFKPRVGRGSSGIFYKHNLPKNFIMDKYISQKIVKGEEYTIDVLCDFNSNPIYIIPRKRINTESGVSTIGKTTYNELLIKYVHKIVEKLKPIGIINIQCFVDKDEINFIEINPRIAGGVSLSFASSDNWFKAIEHFYSGKKYFAKEVVYNNYMFRYYNEVIVNELNLI